MINSFVIYFTITSFIGYIYETIAMTLWGGKWENRGFLLGPVIPIYGSCACLSIFLFEFWLKEATALEIFSIAVIVSAVIEYVVHYTMEKIFNQRWWDYSKAPLNINGRISLLTSLGFGLAGVIIAKIINPFFWPRILALPVNVSQLLSLAFAIIFTADFTITVSIISDFEDKVDQLGDNIDSKIDRFVDHFVKEERALGPVFYSAVDKVDDLKEKVLDDSIDKIGYKVSKFYKNTIKRVIRSPYKIVMKVKNFRRKRKNNED